MTDVSFNRPTQLLQTLDMVWEFGHKLLKENFLFVSLISLAESPVSHFKNDKKRVSSISLFYHTHYFELTLFLDLLVPFFSVSFSKGEESSCHPTNHFHCHLLKHLLLLMYLFDTQYASEVRSKVAAHHTFIIV